MERSRKILFFVSSMNAGGAERVAANLVNNWAGRGDEVTLIVTYSRGGECYYQLNDKVKLIYLADVVKNSRKKTLLHSKIVRLLSIRSLLTSNEPDVVISFLTTVNIAVLVANLFLKYKVVVSERIYPPSMNIGMLWSAARYITYPKAYKVVMQTSAGLKWLNQLSSRAEGCVIPNPCVFPLPNSTQAYKPTYALQDGKKILLAVGRLDTQKGFDILIESFSFLASGIKNWDLVIVGEGSERENLQTLITKKKLESRVHLLGKVGNLSDWYNVADIYVMSSRFEGFPNTLVEAMSHGVACISFDCLTGPTDIIENGKNGYLVPFESGAKGLQKAMIEMIENSKLRKKLSIESIKVRDTYSDEKILKKWDEILG